MMKKVIIYALGIILLGACSKEENLDETQLAKDWFQIKDEPGELNQLRYKIYKEFGCSVFVNDTLGSENRGVNMNGDSIIYYETLHVGYSIEANTNVNFVLCLDSERLLAGIHALYENVIPRLNEIDMLPRSFLIVDTLREITYSSSDYVVKKLQDQKKVMTTTLVGLISESEDGTFVSIENWTQDQLKHWSERVLAAEIYNRINRSKKTFDDFYEYSKSNKDVSYYETTHYEDNSNSYFYDPVEELGFLEWGAMSVRYTTRTGGEKLCHIAPTKEMDVIAFIGAVLTTDENAFMEKHSSRYRKALRDKYTWMKRLLIKEGVLKD